MDERMDVGKVNYYARIDILRRDHLMGESFPNIGYNEKNRRMERMNNVEFQQNFSDVLIRRMLHEKKIPNFNIGGKLLYISDPQTIKELENKIK
jgi:hypothetical protein|tara:strand:- start:2620 stop:2901 length:282 start_codon:yes stop_codon:yes gene_type:complete